MDPHPKWAASKLKGMGLCACADPILFIAFMVVNNKDGEQEAFTNANFELISN